MRRLRSKSSPARQQCSKIVAMRMCSRDWMGSASTPISPRRPETVPLMRSRRYSLSSAQSASGATNELNTETGIPASLPRSEHGEVRRLAKPPDPVARLSPFAETVAPQFGLGRGKRGRLHVLPARVIGVDPRLEVLAPQLRKREQEVGHVSFGIDDERGHAIHRGLLEKIEAEVRSCRSRSSRCRRRASSNRARRRGGVPRGAAPPSQTPGRKLPSFSYSMSSLRMLSASRTPRSGGSHKVPCTGRGNLWRPTHATNAG